MIGRGWKESQWREEQTMQFWKSQVVHFSELEVTDGAMRKPHHPEDAKIQYWGMTYGTLLGANFAAMYLD